MKDFAKSIHVGNANTVSEYNAEIQRLTRKAEQLRRMGQGKSAMEVEKQIEKLGKELRELGNSKVGNSVTEKEFNSEADLRRWCIEHNYTYTPIGGGYYRLEDDKPGSHKPDIEAHVKSGNSKVGNGITKFGLGSYVIADGHKAVVLGETIERGPNGIPFGWVTIRWVEGPWKGQSDQQYDYDLKKA